MTTKLLLIGLGTLLFLCCVHAKCPFAHLWQRGQSAEVDSKATLAAKDRLVHANDQENDDDPFGPKAQQKAASELDFAAVQRDLRVLMTNSQDWWPADFGHYGPFFVRLAWHCTGSYRTSDGRGGCEGGRQRFDPERSWQDNTNLDKARKLLAPLKEKYGLGLSWGDLIVLAGTTAIEVMGGPVLGFCGGRTDDMNGDESILLGPTAEQAASTPCAVDGLCPDPLGDDTLGLIYVNPEGPQGVPDPLASSKHIGEVFGRMSMNLSETVALIGGGHAFGKTHGACPAGPGPNPKEDPSNPWPGACGTGKGKDTFTSGFEGQWTDNPTQWSNDFFVNVLNGNFTLIKGPGGHYQWNGQVPDSGFPIMMLTSDMALARNATLREISSKYATDIGSLNNDFSHAWYKLVTRDMGPRARCLGPLVPPAQPFQNPLPLPPSNSPDWSSVRAAIMSILYLNGRPSPRLPAPDTGADGRPYYGAQFVNAAFRCAASYRYTDHSGGCNGAQIRLFPESEWPENVGVRDALGVLSQVHDRFLSDGLTWADLIVFAGSVALEDALGLVSGAIPFCPGRSDQVDGALSLNHPPRRVWPNDRFGLQRTKDTQLLTKLTSEEFVALFSRPRSAQVFRMQGATGSAWSGANSAKAGTEYFATLLNNTWVNNTGREWKSQNVSMFLDDMAITWDTSYQALVQYYATSSNSPILVEKMVSGWVKMMNNGRYNGPATNECDSPGAIV